MTIPFFQAAVALLLAGAPQALRAAETTAGIPRESARRKAAALPEPTDRQVYKQVGDTALQVWIWKPAGWQASDRRPAMVFYHGGAWRAGSPSAFSRQSAKLAERGMVALSVQYRLTSQPGVTIADCVKDARSAFRWVRAHAAELGIDPARLAAGGGSAGGHLAATLATLNGPDEAGDDPSVPLQPAALVLFNPALQLDSPRAAEAAGLPEVAALRAFSPFQHVPRGHPPTLILHGEADTTVPIADARAYAARVTELGGRCEVVGYPDQPHAFFNKSPYIERTYERMEAFLAELGWITRP
jgi:acetyl esterase